VSRVGFRMMKVTCYPAFAMFFAQCQRLTGQTVLTSSVSLTAAGSEIWVFFAALHSMHYRRVCCTSSYRSFSWRWLLVSISTRGISNSHEFKKWLKQTTAEQRCPHILCDDILVFRSIWSQYYIFAFIDALWNSVIDGLGQAVLIRPVQISMLCYGFVILWY
jgi:hypothetical protein